MTAWMCQPIWIYTGHLYHTSRIYEVKGYKGDAKNEKMQDFIVKQT